MLDRDDIEAFLTQWMRSWNQHDLDGVLQCMVDDVVFEHWTGRVIRGKRSLRLAWMPWFAHHGDFRFEVKTVCIDPVQQSLAFEWFLEWPSPEPMFQGKREQRTGIDQIQLRDGLIVAKRSYIQTLLDVEGRSILLRSSGNGCS